MKKCKGLLLRNNTWWLYASVNGKQIRKSLKIPKDKKKEAEAVVSEFWKQVGFNSLGMTTKNPPLKTLFDSYLRKLKPEVCFEYFEQLYRCFHSFCEELTYRRVQDVKPAQVMEWLNASPYRNKALKTQTNLNAAFNYGVSIDLIDSNPIKGLPRIKHHYKKREALTREQYVEFSKYLGDYSCGKLLFFLMRTGCRFSEAATLQWKDVSLSEQKAIIRATNNKTKKTKPIPLSNDLLELLYFLKTPLVKETDYVFPTSNNKAYLKDNVRRAVKKIGKKIGRPDFTTHALRNTLIELAKGNLLDIQSIVGHSKATTTQLYYQGDMNKNREIVNNLPELYSPRMLLIS